MAKMKKPPSKLGFTEREIVAAFVHGHIIPVLVEKFGPEAAYTDAMEHHIRKLSKQSHGMREKHTAEQQASCMKHLISNLPGYSR